MAAKVLIARFYTLEKSPLSSLSVAQIPPPLDEPSLLQSPFFPIILSSAPLDSITLPARALQTLIFAIHAQSYSVTVQGLELFLCGLVFKPWETPLPQIDNTEMYSPSSLYSSKVRQSCLHLYEKAVHHIYSLH